MIDSSCLLSIYERGGPHRRHIANASRSGLLNSSGNRFREKIVKIEINYEGHLSSKITEFSKKGVSIQNAVHVIRHVLINCRMNGFSPIDLDSRFLKLVRRVTAPFVTVSVIYYLAKIFGIQSSFSMSIKIKLQCLIFRSEPVKQISPTWNVSIDGDASTSNKIEAVCRAALE